MFNTDYFKVVFIITSKCFNEAVFHFSQDFFKKFFPFHIDFPATFLNATVGRPSYALLWFVPEASLLPPSPISLFASWVLFIWGESSSGLIFCGFSCSLSPRPCRCYFHLSVLVAATSCGHLVSLRSLWNRIFKTCDFVKFIDYKCWKSVQFVFAFLWFQSLSYKCFLLLFWVSPAWQGAPSLLYQVVIGN